MEQITVQILKQKIQAGEPMKIIDVRGKEEIASGMIPGAVHIPTNEIMARTQEFNSTVPVYLVCQSGTRSRLVATVMEKQHCPVVNVVGGMNAWDAMQAELGN